MLEAKLDIMPEIGLDIFGINPLSVISLSYAFLWDDYPATQQPPCLSWQRLCPLELENLRWFGETAMFIQETPWWYLHDDYWTALAHHETDL